MKKTIKSVLAVLVICTLCLGLLAGCAGGGVVGTWKATGGEAMGTTVTEDQLGDTSGSVFTLNADGTVTAGGKTGGSWKQDGNKVVISESGMTIEYEFDGTHLVLNMGIMKVIYSRV